jgi:hypothetical protein
MKWDEIEIGKKFIFTEDIKTESFVTIFIKESESAFVRYGDGEIFIMNDQYMEEEFTVLLGI